MPRNSRHFVLGRQWVQVGSGLSDMFRYRSGTPPYQEGGAYRSGTPPYQEGGFLPTTLMSMAAPHVVHAGKKLACRGARAMVEKYCQPKKRKAESQGGSGKRRRKRPQQGRGVVSDLLGLPASLLKQIGLGRQTRRVKRVIPQQQGRGVVSDLLGLPASLLKQIGLGRQRRKRASQKRRQQGGRLQLRRQPWDPPPPFLSTPQLGLGKKKTTTRRRGGRQGHCFSGLP